MDNKITDKSYMTVKEVSEILQVSDKHIRETIRKILPYKMQNGKTTYLNEAEVTAINMWIKQNPHLNQSVEVKTELEKKLLIRQAVALLEEEIFELRLENENANNQIKMLVHDFNKTYTTTEIAKELNFKSAQQLNSILQDKKIQYRQNGTWVLFSNYSDKGYTSIKETVLDSGKIVYDRLWTGSGRQFLLNLIQE